MSRVEKKRSAGTGVGSWRERAMSKWTVDPIPEERYRVGCNIAVNLSQTVVDGDGRSIQDVGR